MGFTDRTPEEEKTPEEVLEMCNDSYRILQDLVVGINEVVQTNDIKGFIQRINKAEAIAPIIDPTLVMKAGRDLTKIKSIAQKLLELKELGITFGSSYVD